MAIPRRSCFRHQWGARYGKSTLSTFLKILLETQHNLRTATLSIDDFYLGAGQRQKLAQDVHPLFITRGVPGTHDAMLGLQTIDRILDLNAGEQVKVPKFIKALDDHAPQAQWPKITGRVDLIIFEGWCVGTQPQSDVELRDPINSLEAQHDPQGLWRGYANEKLQNEYAEWFRRIDRLILLAAPDLSAIHEWRVSQEKQNAQDYSSGNNKIMSATEITEFIQHYERLTCANLKRLPEVADVVLQLDQAHGVSDLRYKKRC